MNEEIVWALQQKLQAEQEAQKRDVEAKKPKMDASKPAAAAKKADIPKPPAKEPMAAAAAKQRSMDEQLADIERKLTAKKTADGPSAAAAAGSTPGLVMSTKMKEKLQREQEERELRDLENAINEEIRCIGGSGWRICL